MRRVVLFLVIAATAGCIYEPHEKWATVRKGSDIVNATSALGPEDLKSFAGRWPLAARLAAVISDDPRRDSACFSPVATDFALAVLLNGAQGDTYTALSHLMSVKDPTPEKLNEANSKLLDVLASQYPNDVHVATSLWNLLPIRFSKSYQDDMAKYYDADAKKLGSIGLAAHRQVNDWVKKRSDGQVTDLVNQISANDTAIVVSIAIVRTQWAKPFLPARLGPFHAPNGTSQVAMMSDPARPARVADGPGFRALTLPFSNDDLEFTAILPEPGKPVSTVWSPALFETVFDNSRNVVADVALPKFSIDDRQDLRTAIAQVGGKTLFQPHNDFSALSHETDGQYMVGQFLQAVSFQIDERGQSPEPADEQEPASRNHADMVFHVDRPFAFCVWERATKTVVLSGVVNRPNG